MAKILAADFFGRDSLTVARELIGSYLVRQIGRKILRLKITEVEAYCGKNDLASHARFGKTKRNGVMFGPAGIFYVYFVYGNHWLLNIVTGKEGDPQAVLIRSAGEITGPGRLTQFLVIDGTFTGKPAKRATGLWFEAGLPTGKQKILKTPRIGVSYAGDRWSKKLFRFVLKCK